MTLYFAKMFSRVKQPRKDVLHTDELNIDINIKNFSTLKYKKAKRNAKYIKIDQRVFIV